MRYKTPLLFFLVIAGACTQNDTPVVAVPGDYYPTASNLQHHYLRESINPYTGELIQADTIQIVYGSDVPYKDKTYTELDFFSKWINANNVPVMNRDIYALLRKDADQYYTPYSSDSSEYVFLDTRKSIGSSWTIYKGFENEFKIVYTIKAVNATKIVNGVTYTNVVEMLQQVYGSFNKAPYELSSSETSYYAKDIGPIYRNADSYSYPGTFRVTLLK